MVVQGDSYACFWEIFYFMTKDISTGERVLPCPFHPPRSGYY